MGRNAAVAKTEWAHHSSSPSYLKSLQIPGPSGPEEERTGVTILKREKKGLLAQSKLCQRQGKLERKDKRRADV